MHPRALTSRDQGVGAHKTYSLVADVAIHRVSSVEILVKFQGYSISGIVLGLGTLTTEIQYITQQIR